MNNRQILVNRAKCTKCNDILNSRYRNHCVSCSCGSIYVDGGLDYLKRGGELCAFEEMAVYSDVPFEEIRKVFERGSFGKKGDEPLHWIKLWDMSNTHLLNTIDYCIDNDSTKYLYLYELEKEYRGI